MTPKEFAYKLLDIEPGRFNLLNAKRIEESVSMVDTVILALETKESPELGILWSDVHLDQDGFGNLAFWKQVKEKVNEIGMKNVIRDMRLVMKKGTENEFRDLLNDIIVNKQETARLDARRRCNIDWLKMWNAPKPPDEDDDRNRGKLSKIYRWIRQALRGFALRPFPRRSADLAPAGFAQGGTE